MTERKTFLRGILGTGGLRGCPRRRSGSAVPEYYTVLPQLKDLAAETTRTRERTTPTQITDQIGTTPTTGAGTTKAGTPGTITLIIMIPGGD